jgi:disulfide bond formation protein DsbB
MTASIAFRPLAALAGLLMFTAIGLAWAFEIVGGFAPCPLCLEQRVPYYIAIPLALAALGAAFAGASVPARLLALVAAGVMVWGAGLGVYHAGVEWGFWEGPASCAAGGGSGLVTDASSLLATLGQTEFISCSEAAGRFLGLSFAGWNVLAAAGAAILLLGAAASPIRR